MKTILRSYLINLASLEATVMLVPGVSNEGGLKTLALATIVLAIMNLLVRPLISLLLLPINLLTLGAFRWLVNVFVLFLLTLVVTQLKISPFTFSGYSYQGFVMPPLEISKLWTLVLASVTMSCVNSFLSWLSTNN